MHDHRAGPQTSANLLQHLGLELALTERVILGAIRC